MNDCKNKYKIMVKDARLCGIECDYTIHFPNVQKACAAPLYVLFSFSCMEKFIHQLQRNVKYKRHHVALEDSHYLLVMCKAYFKLGTPLKISNGMEIRVHSSKYLYNIYKHTIQTLQTLMLNRSLSSYRS